MAKAVFLDRDGVLNYDSPDYVYDHNLYELYPSVPEVITELRSRGYLLIVITNQAGISRGIYTRDQMHQCNDKLDRETGGNIERIYYSPYHPRITRSISRKPGTLLFERAMATYGIRASDSWMVGDKPTDLQPAKRLGIKTIGIQRDHDLGDQDNVVEEIEEILNYIL